MAATPSYYALLQETKVSTLCTLLAVIGLMLFSAVYFIEALQHPAGADRGALFYRAVVLAALAMLLTHNPGC